MKRSREDDHHHHHCDDKIKNDTLLPLTNTTTNNNNTNNNNSTTHDQKHPNRRFKIKIHIGTTSYRFQPKNFFDAISPTSLTDTERLCSEGLNDRCALVTSGKSDQYYFKHAEKNKYEKLMFKCEDEMFELDMLVESVKVTIKNVAQLMEKINNNIDIAEMIHIKDYLTPQNLRCIKKLYSKLGVDDIVDTMRKNPLENWNKNMTSWRDTVVIRVKIGLKYTRRTIASHLADHSTETVTTLKTHLN
ncbi:hypothetical protein G4B88_000062 [Cannabis sativa]|uniref:Histone deacetylase interacting domain-containing protein n=1 Tax=Cannabis sativa TaxID=3483 RepID=A0A7J6G049_CANSA|nr:hypothetical protein G4B88_000062 [Cannabis sativa]